MPMSPALYVADSVFPVAFSMLPEKMDSPAARAQMLAIGFQESLFKHRFQVMGPARGFWQFERGGGVRGVLEHPATRPHLLPILERLIYAPDADKCYEAIAHNDVLAAVFARLLLWTHPKALPGRNEDDAAWQYYIDTWRPGKPHRGTWDVYNARAWEIVLEKP